MTRKKVKKIATRERIINILLAFFIAVCLYSIYSLVSIATEANSNVENNVSRFTIIEDNKPTYDYLKSVTVFISGVQAVERDYDTTELDSCLAIYDIEEVGDKDLIQWSGTGSIITVKNGKTYILTNGHVAGNKFENPTLYIHGIDKKVPATVVAYHNFLDLAILEIKGLLKGKRSVIGYSYAKPSDPVYLVGHHLGRPYIYGEGVFAGYDEIYDIIQIPIAFGNSGSAVMNVKGEVIAVIFAVSRVGIFDYDLSHGIAVDGLSVQIFLKQNGLL